MDLNPAETTTLGWLIAKAAWLLSPVYGSVLSILIGKDYSMVRIVTGVMAGIFMAYYFTDWLIFYLPTPPDMPETKAQGMVGALWGLTGYFVVNQLIEAARSLDFTYFVRMVGGNGKK